MSEIRSTFAKLKTFHEGGLIAYVVAGDPEPSRTPGIVDALVAGGVDIVELGIPFSDPIADGPTIQAAAARALKAGTTPRKVLKLAEEIKEKNKIPLVIMTYFNPLFRMGLKDFFKSASACGVDGIIVPDLPVEESREYREVAEAHGIDTILLAAPSTSAERLGKIVESTSGFLYLVSIFGVTGTRERILDSTMNMIKKTLSVTLEKIPLAVGFGISKPEHVKAILQNGADAAIVGSGFVKLIEKKQRTEEKMLESLEDYARDLKKATTKNDNMRGKK